MIELDHIVLPVEDLKSAAVGLENAGFVVTPVARHPFGTANRLIVFEGAYVELVTVVDRARIPERGLARRVADHLRHGRAGFSHIACRADSIDEALAHVGAASYEAAEPMWFSRPAPRSDGSELTASFTLLPIVDVPHQFFCIHHTREAIWFRPHLEHPNRTRTIAEVFTDSEPGLAIESVSVGDRRIVLDTAFDPITISGVTFG
jgi:hypothetical protein